MKRKIVSGIMLTLLFVGMLASAFKVQPVRAVDWWTMFHHDLNHTGYSTSTAPNTNNTIWSYTTGDVVTSSPAVADGKVYVGSRDGNVYAFGLPVGGIWVPADKLSLLAPYIALVSTITLAVSISVAYIKYRKKQ